MNQTHTRTLIEIVDEKISRMEEDINRLSKTLYTRINELYEEIGYVNQRINRLETRLKTLRKTMMGKEESASSHEEIMHETEFHKIPLKDAKELVMEYIQSHPGSTTSDIFLTLNLEPELVLKALNELRKEGKIRGVPLER